jgi:hypothetical protein
MKNNILIVLLFLLLISACAQVSKESEATNIDPLPGTDQANAPQLATTPANDVYSDGKTQLIKTANYRFEVDNVKKSTEVIMAAIRKYPAYISSSSLHLKNPILENKMAIRVQNQYFHELLQEIDLQAKFVNHRDVITADVSKEFVDLESRLKTKREVEVRYMEILRKKAGTIEELLNAEQQIGELHEEIEATISRINYLKEQVSYSTINLEFYQKHHTGSSCFRGACSRRKIPQCHFFWLGWSNSDHAGPCAYLAVDYYRCRSFIVCEVEEVEDSFEGPGLRSKQ